jgi:hypothetical protein
MGAMNRVWSTRAFLKSTMRRGKIGIPEELLEEDSEKKIKIKEL